MQWVSHLSFERKHQTTIKPRLARPSMDVPSRSIKHRHSQSVSASELEVKSMSPPLQKHCYGEPSYPISLTRDFMDVFPWIYVSPQK